ncbi:hypothetical protein CK203_092529 [Vitis vinifera]|uniref:Retrotransposon gag domain-containing protein n=1 Tax=Vitis vinifera TaxID=29760 RepID=A0A438DHQ0_VITVI|nr:hypothetical protein CK203_092529 [Vitis vinifera]
MPATQTVHTISHDQATVIPPTITPVTIIEDPRSHFIAHYEALGLDEAQLLTLFPLSLSGVTQRWYASLESSRRRTWEDLAQEFLRQYSFSGDTSVTRRELEFLRQGSDESVSFFISRWREKAAEMIERPTERDQMSMFLRSLHPRFARHLTGVPFQDFRSLVQALFDVDNGISRGLWSDIIPSPDTEGRELVDHLRAMERMFCGLSASTTCYHPYARSLQIPRSDFTFTSSSSSSSSADLIDSGAVSFPVSTTDTDLGPDMTADSFPAYSTHAVPPPSGLYHHVECEEFEPMVVLSWRGATYDLWVAYDMRVGRLLDEVVTYFAHLGWCLPVIDITLGVHLFMFRDTGTYESMQRSLAILGFALYWGITLSLEFMPDAYLPEIILILRAYPFRGDAFTLGHTHLADFDTETPPLVYDCCFRWIIESLTLWVQSSRRTWSDLEEDADQSRAF